MKFKYRFSDREFRESLRLNHAARPQRWQAHLFVMICLIPSLVFFWFLNAGLSLIWFGVMLVGMACYALHAYVSKLGYPETYDQELVLSERSYCNSFSHSKTQSKWGLFEQIIETPHAFQFQRLSRYWMVPKRALGSQVEACREFFKQVQNQPLDDSPIELYQEIFAADTPYPIFRYKYQASDLETASKSKFENAVYGFNPQNNPNKFGNRMAWAIVIISFVAGIWLIKDATVLLRIQPMQILARIVAWILPVFWLLAYTKVLPLFRQRGLSRVPPDVCELRLSETGWAVGDQQGVVFFDWRDVTGIFYSADFFGFKTVNQFLNLVPRRIFSDPTEGNRFLAQAIDLRQRALIRNFIPVATVVESSNPYQTPLR